MKIAVLSDTHNNTSNLSRVIQLVEQHNVSTLIHCGDLTSVETAALLNGFRVILTFGNGDFASGALRDQLLRMNRESYAGMHFEGTLGGCRIAVTHGHVPGVLETWLHQQRFEYIFTGHSHYCSDQRNGITRVINPGALGGLKKEPRSFLIVDLHSAEVQWITIAF